MEDRGRRLFDSFLFYAIVLMMVTLLAALFLPAASVLREVGNERGQGPWILLPLSFLILSFLYGFIRARGYLRRSRLVPAYGWLLGSTLLPIVLLYFYLKQMTGH